MVTSATARSGSYPGDSPASLRQSRGRGSSAVGASAGSVSDMVTLCCKKSGLQKCGDWVNPVLIRPRRVRLPRRQLWRSPDHCPECS